jgi:MATE family multidrug resistance protein
MRRAEGPRVGGIVNAGTENDRPHDGTTATAPADGDHTRRDAAVRQSTGMRTSWRRELRATLRLSWPLVLTNLAQTAMTVTDVIFIGGLGPQALAAGALGANIYHAVMLFTLGLVSATAPMVARELGARTEALGEVRSIVHQGLWTAIAISIPAVVMLWYGEAILLALRQSPVLATQAGEYLRALLWALPPFLGYIVLRSFVAALQRPRWAFVVAIAAIALNAFGNWVLIHGKLGLPALGLIGSGLASAIASLFLFLGLAAVVALDRGFARYRLFARPWHPDRARLATMWKLGMPIAVTIGFEVTVFSAAAFLMGWLGEAELAAHAIAIQIASVTFMLPLGISQAATVRVGLAFGARNAHAVTRAGWSGFALGVGSMMVMAMLMVALPRTMIGVFLDTADAANAQVVALAVSFLAVAALFQVVDGAQVMGAGMLRGLHDTRVPMYYAAAGYWGIGLPSGAALAFWAGWRGVGIWSGLAIGLAVVSALMIHRWLRRERLGLMR